MHPFAIKNNDDDPDSILEGIQGLDKAIRCLHHFKSLQYQQLNAIRSSTRALPNEILLYVFRFFCLLFGSGDLPQFTLGGVSTHWRHLVNTEPRFWRSLHLHIHCKNISSSISLFEVFKERNAGSFEHLELIFQTIPSALLHRLRDELKQVVLEQFHHAQPSALQAFLPSLRGLSKLQRVGLYDPPVDILRFINDYYVTPEVYLIGPWSHFRVKRAPALRFLLPWSTVTNLALSKIEVDICCELLLGCPNLASFCAVDTVAPTKDCTMPNTRHARQAIFPRIEHLLWHSGYSQWDEIILSFYCFPALICFRWHGDAHNHSMDLFHSFTCSLPRSCQLIHLTNVITVPTGVEPALEEKILLHIAGPIEHLYCSHFDMSSLSMVLEKLRDPTFIPKLTWFKWKHREHRDRSFWGPEGEKVLELVRLFRDVLRTRKEIGSGVFRKEIQARFKMEIGGMWLGMVGGRFGRFDRKGVCELMECDWFRFKIARNGDCIMYF